MARPTKHNVSYFAHDVGMRNDLKVQALRRKFGHEGYSTWNMILELLGDNEYFEYEWTELNIELLSADFNIDVDRIHEIINYCIKLDMLQKENNYLTSDKFTERLESVVLQRRKGYCRDNSKRKGLLCTLTPLKEDNVIINRQSKVKESKVNNIKEKESKAKESKAKDITKNKTNSIDSARVENFNQYFPDN